MKYIRPIVICIAFIALTIYIIMLRNDTGKQMRQIELLENQITTINRIVNSQNPDTAIILDQETIDKADYSFENNDQKTYIFYSNTKNLLDTSIVVDALNRIQYIGYYKP